LASTTSRRPWTRAPALGPIAWTSGYVLLPLATVHKPIWKYDARTLANDLSAHVLYGTAVSAAYWALAREEPWSPWTSINVVRSKAGSRGWTVRFSKGDFHEDLAAHID
jgi:hypothetical protein